MTEAVLEILDLRHFSARQLRPLLEQEADVWKQRLHWDYQTSTELLLQYLDSRVLPGFVALLGGRICGFTFCVYEGHKAVVGDVYVLQELVSGHALNLALTRHLLAVLEASPDIDRIESQLLLFESGALAAPFLDLGFTNHPRLYQVCHLDSRAASGPNPAEPLVVPPEFELCAWNAGFYQSAAELIHSAYEGHIDAQINDQYRSLHGSLRFLHNIVRFPGCGVFDPASSWVLRERRFNTLVGLLLCSRVAARVAHITQLCIAPAFRAQGLGQLLMRHSARQLPREGYAASTLTVTEANQAAVGLYQALGFVTLHRFDAMVRDKVAVPFQFPSQPPEDPPQDAPDLSEGPPPLASATRKGSTEGT